LDWTVRESNSVERKISLNPIDWFWGYPASCAMDTGLFPRLNMPERGFDLPPPSRTEVEVREELHNYSLWALMT
jgi:hypothetical protein